MFKQWNFPALVSRIYDLWSETQILKYIDVYVVYFTSYHDEMPYCGKTPFCPWDKISGYSRMCFLSKCKNLGWKEGIIKKSIKNTILTSYYKNLKLWTCNTAGSVYGLNWPPIPLYRREKLNTIVEKVLLPLWYTSKLIGDNKQEWVKLEQNCCW